MSRRDLVVWIILGAATAAVLAYPVTAMAANAEPKAYLLLLAGLAILGLAVLWRRWAVVATALALIGATVSIAAAITGWTFPLDANAAARAVEARYPRDGHVRCIPAPAYEYPHLTFGRVYDCYWDKFGGIRPGQGIGVEVDDSHIVRVYP